MARRWLAFLMTAREMPDLINEGGGRVGEGRVSGRAEGKAINRSRHQGSMKQTACCHNHALVHLAPGLLPALLAALRATPGLASGPAAVHGAGLAVCKRISGPLCAGLPLEGLQQ